MDLLYQLERIFSRTYTYRILDNFLELLRELYPYLLAGILVIAVLQRRLPSLVRFKVLRSAGTLNILAAALLGMAAPLPVYLAVPLSVSLIAAGFPAPVMVAFLFACPLIDPNLFLLTYGAFGWPMAAARAVSALALGFFAGLLCRRFAGRLSLFPKRAPETGSQAKPAAMIKERPFLTALWRQSLFILKIFSVSLLISAALKALVPPEFVRSLVGQSSSFSILLAIALGVPFYQCGGASIPIMQALYELGLGKGAILAFFISGPATKLSALYAFREGYGDRFLLLYLAYTLAGAFLAGVLFNLRG